jgi:hypothetical protein
MPLPGGNGSGRAAGPGSAWQAPGGGAAAGYPQAGSRGRGPGYPDQGAGERRPQAGPAHGMPGYAEPGYSALAVSEPAADVISTQTWDAVDDDQPAWSDTITTDRGPQPMASSPPSEAQLPIGHAVPHHGYPQEDDDTLRVRPFPGAGGPKPGGTADRTVTRPPRSPGRGHGTRGRARPRGRRRGRVLLAGGLAVAVVGGIAAYVLVSGPGRSAPPAPTSPQAATVKPTSTVGAPPASLGPWGYIGSRTTDPEPLTLGELFPAQFSNAGITYSMTADKERVHCNLALVGSQLQAAAGQADCTQAMVASYLSSNDLMGTIGVLNLNTAAGAQSSGNAAGASNYVAQLPGPSGPTKSLGSGTGIEAAEVKGHYLVLVWAELTTLKPPNAAQKLELQTFISLLIQKTANVSLASREVTGKPPI